MQKSISPLGRSVEDDGSYIPEVGDWSEDKYRLLFTYADMFATAMKKKWNERCYIDLFAGAGYARIRGTGRIVQSSSLLALQVNNPFDRYIFCDSNSECISALKARAERRGLSNNCVYLHCDVNESIEEIISYMPSYGKKHKVISFCFIDPFKISDVRFSAIIERLSSRFIDFLVHFPVMDPTRNKPNYFNGDSEIISDYIGKSAWEKIKKERDPKERFEMVLGSQIDQIMGSFGYGYGGLKESKLIRSTAKKLPLYRLIFYSRHQLGAKFWKTAIKSSSQQPELPYGEEP